MFKVILNLNRLHTYERNNNSLIIKKFQEEF